MLFPWTLGARDVIQEKQLAEIIEWEHKYVYLFNAFSYANRESVCCLMALSKEDNKSIPQPSSMGDKLNNRAETGKCPIFQGFEVRFPQLVPEW